MTIKADIIWQAHITAKFRESTIMVPTKFVVALILSYTSITASSFAIQTSTCASHSIFLSSTKYTSTSTCTRTSTTLRSSVDDDINRQLARSREILEKAKAKMAENEKNKNTEATTLLTTDVKDEKINKKESVTKTTDDEGLNTFDGELMAALSETEDWELKGLLDVFEDEIEESDVAKSLAKRDVAASIFNMRVKMHGADYRRIFDTRNRFIGEDN